MRFDGRLPMLELRFCDRPSLTIDMRGEGSPEGIRGGRESPVPSASILESPIEFLYMDGL